MKHLLKFLPILLVLTSCSYNKSEMQEIINNLKIDAPDSFTFEGVKDTIIESTVINESGSKFKIDKVQATYGKKLADFIVFNPTLNSIWPGAFVSKKSIDIGKPAIINTLERDSIQIWIDLHSDERITSRKIEPSPDEVTSAIKNIVIGKENRFSPGILFQESQNRNSEKTLLEFNFDTKWPSGSLSTMLTQKSSKESNSIVIKITRPLYSAQIKLPSSGGNLMLLKDKQNKASFDKAFSNDNPLFYVNSVTYGTMLFFQIESKSSFSEISKFASLVQNFSSTEVDAKILNNEAKNLEEFKFSVISAGGVGDGIKKTIQNKDIFGYLESVYDSLQTIVPVPISYTIHDFASNNPISVHRTIDYNYESKYTGYKRVKFNLEHMKIIRDGDEFPHGEGEFFWNIIVNNSTLSRRTRGNIVEKDDGEYQRFNVSRTFNMPLSTNSEMVLNATISERDRGASGSDDVIRINKRFNISELPFKNNMYRPPAIRGVYASDPKIDLQISIEDLGDVYPN